MKHWGTPDYTSILSDSSPSITALWDLPWRKSLIKEQTWKGTPSWGHYSCSLSVVWDSALVQRGLEQCR